MAGPGDTLSPFPVLRDLNKMTSLKSLEPTCEAKATPNSLHVGVSALKHVGQLYFSGHWCCKN